MTAPVVNPVAGYCHPRFKAVEGALISNLKVGDDIGGEMVNSWIRMLSQTKRVLQQFRGREIQVKDIERGLLDFPAIIGGREVFLCWEQDEDDVEFWHEIDAGYAGRERL